MMLILLDNFTHLRDQAVIKDKVHSRTEGSRQMKRLSLAVMWGVISVSLNLFMAGNVCSADYSLNINDLELQVKVVTSDRSSSNRVEERERNQLEDQLDLTVGGTYKYKKYELPPIPPIPGIPDLPPVPTYPRGALLIEDSKALNISGNGRGNSSHWALREDCRDGTFECQDFVQEGTAAWNYDTVDPLYLADMVTELEIKQESENAPVRYKFRLRVLSVGDYVKASGSGTTTTRGFEVNETTSFPIESYGATFSGRSWDDWSAKNNGGRIEGELTFQGDEFVASGHIVHNYNYVSDSGEIKNGTVEIYYKINPKPGAKKIQVNQALGRYKYLDELHYVPASDFAAGKDTAIQVFYDQAVPVEKLSGAISLEVEKDGSGVCTLSDFTKDLDNNALIFRPKSRSECGDWQEGKYKFTAKLKDAEETLDNIQFQERRRLKVLGVPVKANYGGTIKTPGNQWKNGHKFMRQVYPVGYRNVIWEVGPLLDGSADDINIEANQKKIWTQLNDKAAGGYDLVIGFIESAINDPAGELRGFTWPGGKAVVVVNSTQDMSCVVAHEVGHIFSLGDEYNGGSFNPSVNSPPFGYVGTAWTSSSVVTASNKDVKPVPAAFSEAGYVASGSLISEKLHPYEGGGRGLLKDSMSFMGSGALKDKTWISPDAWKQLFRSLPPDGAAASSLAKQAQAAAVTYRVVEASGWVSKSGAVQLSLPWGSSTAATPVETRSGDYAVQAVDSAGTVLGSQGFTPGFLALTNPPREKDPAPFAGVRVPFPEGTVRFRVVDRNGALLNELPVSPGIPVVAVSKPTQGEIVSGPYTISWTGSDPDGDVLFYKIEYSLDGQKWVQLATRVTATSLVKDFGLLPGGSHVQIRVTASDGVNSASALSGTFNVPLKPVEVYIDEPQPGSIHRIEAGISFQGSAHDPQQGEFFDDQKLVWSSDRDGEIGRGASLFVSRNLSAGQHLVTLTASDSLGQPSSRSITIHVLPAPPNFDPDGGIFAEPVSVRITGIAAGMAAFYTSDGSDPTANPGALPYLGAFSLAQSATLKAALYHAALKVWSSVTTRDFVISTAGSTPPETVIGEKPVNPTRSTAASFTFSASLPGSLFECRLDGSVYEGCVSPKNYSALAEGGHLFEVRAVDPTGIMDATPASCSWSIDNTPPAFTVNPIPATTGAASLTIGGSVEPGATVTVTLNDGTPRPATIGTSWSYALTGLAPGTNSIAVTAADAAGNTSSFSTTTNFIADSPVRLANAPQNFFSSVGEAYLALAGNGTIQARVYEFVENLNLDRPISVIFKGGYDSGYTSNSSYTTLRGRLTLAKGTLAVERLVIR